MRFRKRSYFITYDVRNAVMKIGLDGAHTKIIVLSNNLVKCQLLTYRTKCAKLSSRTKLFQCKDPLVNKLRCANVLPESDRTLYLFAQRLCRVFGLFKCLTDADDTGRA